MQEQVGLRIALGQLLVAVAQYRRQVGEPGCVLGDAQALQGGVERELARGGGQQILAAQHVGDLHQRVVDRIDQRVQRFSVAAGQREIRDGTGRERRPAANQVVPRHVGVGHPQPHHRVATLGTVGRALLVGEVAVVVVVAEFGVATGGQVAGFDLLGGGERLVGVAGSISRFRTSV